MISIPSLPATPAVAKAAPQPTPASSISDSDPNSFANYLKAIQNHRPTQETATAPLTGAKDKATKDSKASDDDKKKSALLTDTTPVPVTTATPAPQARAFQLAWSHAKGDSKSQPAGSGNAAAQLANNSQLRDSQPEDSQDVKTGALKSSVSDAIANAPVAFGANLSKADVLRADGLKAGEAKAGELKANDARPKISSAETATQKTAAEIAKPVESKNSSANQQHSDSSSEDQASAGNTVKAATASSQSAAAPAEGFAAVHAAASSSDPVASGDTAVQSAYSPTHTSLEKTAPVALTAAVTEPAQTPSVRPQNIDLKIAGADNKQVDVRVSQRAGDVQVTVRTPDGDLAQSLRQHLPELSDRLSQAGVSGNLWQPQTASAGNTGNNDADSRYSDDAQTQQQNQQQHSRNSNSNQGGQQQDGRPQSSWLNELNQANKEN